MPISMDIPQSLRLPLFWAQVDPSQAGTFANYQRAVILGYKKAAAPATADTLTRVSSADQAKALYGRGSQHAHMFEAWYKNNRFDETWGLTIEPPSAGTAATGTVLVAGPATTSGAIYLYIAGRRVSANVVAGDAATAIATALGAAINAMPDLPVAASVTSATVTLTCNWKGIDGNNIDIRANYLGSLGGEALPAGVTLTITPMSGGVGVPDLSAALAGLGDQEFEDRKSVV